MKKGFTFIELLIILAILGILAALAAPLLQGHITSAKEASAKDNLRILRSAIEIYAAHHNGVAPGYKNDNPADTPHENYFRTQLCDNNAYLKKIPVNPFNNSDKVYVIGNNTELSLQSSDYGWVYQPQTKDIKLNTNSVDSQGKDFLKY